MTRASRLLFVLTSALAIVLTSCGPSEGPAEPAPTEDATTTELPSATPSP